MQRYFTLDKCNNKFILRDDDLYHIKTVMRMKNDDKIEVIYDKKIHICSINNIESDITIIENEILDNTISNEVYSVIIIPVLKEQKFDLILQKATELGVSEIIPYLSKRSVVKLDKDDFSKKIIRWNKILKEASEQSKRVDIPILNSIKNIDDLNCIDGVKLMCSTVEKSKNIKKYMNNISNYDKISFVIGPEGGFDKTEEEKLIDMDFVPITLGNRIMRVETVPIFLMSVLNYINME